MSVAGKLSKAFAKVSPRWQRQMDNCLATAARLGVNGKDEKAQELLWHDLKRWLDCGAQVDTATDVNGYDVTALGWACARGHDIVAMRLLEAGADPDRRTDTGTRPFLIAARDLNLPLLRALKAAGADAGNLDMDQHGALYQLLMHNNKVHDLEGQKNIRAVFDFLTKDCGLEMSADDKRYMFTTGAPINYLIPALSDARELWNATKIHDHDRMKRLLDRGVPADSALEYSTGPTALHMAIEENDEAAIRLLIMAHASPALALQTLGKISPETAAFIKTVEAERGKSFEDVTAGQKITVSGPLKLKTAPTVKS